MKFTEQKKTVGWTRWRQNARLLVHMKPQVSATRRLQQRFNIAARFCGSFHLVAAQPVVLPVSAPGGGRTPVLSNPTAKEIEGIPDGDTLYFLAEAVGFEPTSP